LLADIAFLRFGSGLLSASLSIVLLFPLQLPLGTLPQAEFITHNACVFLQNWDSHCSCLVVAGTQRISPNYPGKATSLKNFVMPGTPNRYFTISTNDFINTK